MENNNNNLEALNDDLMEFISGGTLEETQELLDWCNRHGAGITRPATNSQIRASLFSFLAGTYPELNIQFLGIRNNEMHNNYNGMKHADFMNKLRTNYGD